MNQDIEKMSEAQHLWDEVLKHRDEIARKNKSIDYWRNDLASMIGKEGELKNSVKSTKGLVMSREAELADKDSKITKLLDKKKIVQTERELKAVDGELESIKKDQGNLEDEILSLLDKLESEEKNLTTMTPLVATKQIQVEKDIAQIQKEIHDLEKEKSRLEELFNQSSQELSSQVKSKFLKLILSKEGKAIAEVKNEICQFCNFKIPADLAIQAAKNKTIQLCTNCGRFIYARN